MHGRLRSATYAIYSPMRLVRTVNRCFLVRLVDRRTAPLSKLCLSGCGASPLQVRRATSRRLSSCCATSIESEGETAPVNVSSYFNDPDGDALTYSAATSNAAVAGVSVSGSTMTIAGVAPGTATVTVTARDPGGLEARRA